MVFQLSEESEVKDISGDYIERKTSVKAAIEATGDYFYKCINA